MTLPRCRSGAAGWTTLPRRRSGPAGWTASEGWRQTVCGGGGAGTEVRPDRQGRTGAWVGVDWSWRRASNDATGPADAKGLEDRRRGERCPAERISDQERGVRRSGEGENPEKGRSHRGHDAGREASLGG